jgi:hypothetical protein
VAVHPTEITPKAGSAPAHAGGPRD